MHAQQFSWICLLTFGERLTHPDRSIYLFWTNEHWLVDDMFIFQNTGFTKVVGNRFLVCVDCEIGPIGCHCLDDKNSFYVSLEWVFHD
ncbi:hypothetical protein FD755_010988 [Muntiacus reevesi]|uniref:Uncharacterized protein n=1 Tax=Muntiacus reevesi TaxID=9886 RepID=A0A5N3XVF2_MUNRE|nr:hypothetical protein FD755_010988 [Muntiacus reevesi]